MGGDLVSARRMRVAAGDGMAGQHVWGSSGAAGGVGGVHRGVARVRGRSEFGLLDRGSGGAGSRRWRADAGGHGDVGGVMGIGFPANLGGPFHYADVEGLNKIVKNMRRLEEKYGERFKPAELLVEMAQNDKTFFPKK